MKEASFIIHRGVRILRIDFTAVTSNEQLIPIMGGVKEVIAREPKESVRTLTILADLDHFRFDSVTAGAFKEFIEHNKPYVVAGAVIGVTGLRRALYNSLIYLTRRDIKLCTTEEEAKEYLAQMS